MPDPKIIMAVGAFSPAAPASTTVKSIYVKMAHVETVKIKICGLTRVEDAEMALRYGADFIGLNLFSGPRKITVQRAGEILKTGDATKHAVALVDLSTDVGYSDARALAEVFGVRRFQLYGDPMRVRRLPVEGLDYWPVFRIARGEDLRNIDDSLRAMPVAAAAILLDGFSTSAHGGTGTRIDLAWLAEARKAGAMRTVLPVILAGGLNARNVADAIATICPWAVDVSSGVEYAGQPGIKDHAEIASFIAAVRAASSRIK